MPIIQPGFPVTTPPTIQEPTYTMVYVRRSWDPSALESSTWVPEPYLRPIVAHEEMLQGNSYARFRWLYGAAIKHQDQPGFAEQRPVLNTFADWFVMIVISTTPPSTTNAPTVPLRTQYPIWFGIIPRQSFNVYGTQTPAGGTASVAQGEQILEAYGLDWLLERTDSHGSHVDPYGDERVDAAIAFNDRGERGAGDIGNRSTAKSNYHRKTVFNEDIAAQRARAYHFSSQGAVWNHEQVVEYLLETRAGFPEFKLSGDPRNLRDTTSVVERDGRTVREIINSVVDRRRGLGCAVRVVNAGVAPEVDYQPELYVFSLFGEPFSAGNQTMFANTNQVTVTLTGIDPHRVTIEIDRGNAVNGLIVRGAPLRTMLSLSFADGSLDEDWTGTEQAAYNSGAFSDNAETNDSYRADFSGVYRRFKIPSTFNWRPRGGNGGQYFYALPKFGFDAELLAGGGESPIWQHHLRLDRELFLQDDESSEYTRPFALMYNQTAGKHFYIDRPSQGTAGNSTGTVSGHLRMLDHLLGIEVIAQTAHAIALGVFSAVYPTSVQPVVDYRQMIATVCARTHIQPAVVISDIGDHGTIQVIDVPDAEFWWLTRGTVVGVTPTGFPQRADETSVPNTATNAWTAQGILIRNDGNRLRRIAALARAWYQSQRAKVTLVKTKLDGQYPIGTMIRRIVDDWRDEEIGTVVSARTWNFEEEVPNMVIETQYVQPDFAGIIR